MRKIIRRHVHFFCAVVFPSFMKLAACQWDIIWENKLANFDKIHNLLKRSEANRDLILLPEMFSTGFSMNAALIAESDSGESTTFLKKLAAQTLSAVLGGVATREPSQTKGKNELFCFSPSGKELCRYQKNRTFRYTGESDHYENGTEITTFEWAGGKICPLICYDLRFPELFRIGAKKGAECFIVIASWPAVRISHWTALLRARAIENLAWVIGVNRCGSDPENDYPGKTVVFDPQGNLVNELDANEGVLEATIDWDLARDWRAKFPALDDLSIS